MKVIVLAGGLCACEKEEIDDIDMSGIDFSNIEDLYAQPLPVIQKCVQGKWKIFAEYGGIWGVNYLQNTFVEIYEDHYVKTNYDGSQITMYFTWEKQAHQ